MRWGDCCWVEYEYEYEYEDEYVHDYEYEYEGECECGGWWGLLGEGDRVPSPGLCF